MFGKISNASVTGRTTITLTRGDNKYLIDNSPLAPVDIDKVVKNFRISEEAKQDANKDLPDTASVALSPTEQKIENIYQEIVTQYATYASGVLNNKDSSMHVNTDDVKNAVSNARIVPVQFKNELEQMINGNKVQLDFEKARIDQATKDYEIFQRENNLFRPCKESNVYSTFISILILIFIVGVESIANATLFSTNLDGGLLAGFFYAMFFSSINAGISFSLGYKGLIYMNHVSKSRRLIGFLSLVVFVAFVCMFGLFVGHYRDALQTSVETATSIGWESFKENPLGLKDMMSWILFLVTVAMGCLALADGYYFRDCYPGYADKTREYNNSRNRWDEFYCSLINQLNAHQTNHLQSFNDYVKRAQHALASIKSALIDKETILNEYQNAHRNAQKAIRAVISQYRHDNQLLRKSPAPKYFFEYEIFNYDFIPPIVAGKEWAIDITNEIKVGHEKITELNRLVDQLTSDQVRIQSEIIQTYRLQRGALEGVYGTPLTTAGIFENHNDDYVPQGA